MRKRKYELAEGLEKKTWEIQQEGSKLTTKLWASKGAQPRVVGEEAHVPCRSAHVVARLRDRLAHVTRVSQRELTDVLLHEVSEPVQDHLSLLVAHAWPRTVVECPPRCRDGEVSLGLPAACDRCPWLTGVRIDVGHGGSVEGRHLTAVDEVAVEVHVRSLLWVRPRRGEACART